MITPVILCGGSGTRPWPFSRAHMPNQRPAVRAQVTMPQTAARRLSDFNALASTPPIVVCNDAHRFATHAQLIEIGEVCIELIEIQLGGYLGENDIVRLEDRYRRH